MSNIIIKLENISKQYRLGQLGTGTISHDINRWWHRILGKEDPYLKIGEENDRGKRGNSEYVWALRDIHLEVKQGEVLGIIGNNGAGKSTLLKLLSRITAPTSGSIKIKGRVASLLELGTGFHPELTARENIFLNGSIMGMTRQEVGRKFDEIVDFAGIERYIDTPVKRFSSGMYVRLAFAVAAHLEPEILIVDEVLAVGDAAFQKKCIGKMSEVAQQEGRTIIFVSHNMAAIRSLCENGIILNNGSLIHHSGIDECIGAYLLNLRTQIQNKYIAESRPGKIAWIKEVCLQDSNGQGRDLYDVDDELTISIRVIVNEQIEGTTPLLDLRYNGDVLYRSFSSDCNEEILNGMQPGEYVFTTKLYAPLKKGIYSVDVRLIKIHVLFYDQVDSAILFEVDELQSDLSFKSYSHKRAGIIGVNMPWHITCVTLDDQLHEQAIKPFRSF